jgi:hypothetical protein
VSVKTPAKGHSRKHVHHAKHGKHGKHHLTHHKKPATAHSGHHVSTVGKHPSHGKARGYAVGDLLPVCSFEAVAASLRVLGQRVSDDDVLGLWDLCGQREVSIAEALAAAARFGLAGYIPTFGEPFLDECGDLALLDALGTPGIHRPTGRAVETGRASRLSAGTAAGDLISAEHSHGLILGVDLPGPHAVLATPGGWWSWGELYSPWPCRVEEAWAVSWA